MPSKRKMEAKKNRQSKKAKKAAEQLAPGHQSKYALKQRREYSPGLGLRRMRKLRGIDAYRQDT